MITQADRLDSAALTEISHQRTQHQQGLREEPFRERGVETTAAGDMLVDE
jgi:hypothetical protein